MKKLLQILILSAYFSTTASPQDRIHREVIPENLNTERLLETHQFSAGGLQGMDYREYLRSKSESINLKTALRNQQVRFYEAEGFDTRDSRTTIKRTLLGNGFLLTEVILKLWDSSAWMNAVKRSYKYDGNNNETEQLWQQWDNSAWVNYHRYSYTYDGNNNQTGWLYQNWNNSAWVNYHKYSYTYDENNNQTEWLRQIWDSSVWENYLKNSYTYDGNNNLTEELYQFWDGSAWANWYWYSYTYDGNNNQIESLC